MSQCLNGSTIGLGRRRSFLCIIVFGSRVWEARIRYVAHIKGQAWIADGILFGVSFLDVDFSGEPLYQILIDSILLILLITSII